jgi:hypothetical protein
MRKATILTVIAFAVALAALFGDASWGTFFFDSGF